MDRQAAKQIDKEGVWIANTSQYRWAHGTREGVYFEPGQPTKVALDEWIKSQSAVLKEMDDPFGELPASDIVKEDPKDGKRIGMAGVSDLGKVDTKAKK